MNRIIRFWNQNRGMLIFAIIALAFLIIIVHVLNALVRDQNKEKMQNQAVLTEEEKALPRQSIIGGSTVDVETTKDNVEAIDTFIEYCNNGDTTAAYNMLTDDCKEELYPTEETFADGYRNIIFTTKRTTIP